MASTYIEYRKKGFEANDGFMAVWLLLIIDEIDKLTNAPTWLTTLRDDWFLEATEGFGYGVDPALDHYIHTSGQRDTMLTLAERALMRLKGYGPSISCDELNRIREHGKDFRFTSDLPIDEFVRTAEFFTRLLREELRPDETDSRIFRPRPSPPPNRT